MAAIRALLLTSCVVAATACRLDELVDGPPGHALRVTPERVTDSAAFGSALRREPAVTVTAVSGGPGGWIASAAGAPAWLALGDTSGPPGGTLRLTLDPAGLPLGTHRDTIVVSPAEGDWSPVRVPVEFRVHPCIVRPMRLDEAVDDVLGAADCGAPHRPGSFARLYAFDAGANDSISIVLTAPALTGVLILGRAAAADPPLATADACQGGSATACLWYRRLPAAGNYVLEVTTSAAGDTGAFSVRALRPQTPAAPDALAQFAGDSTTPLPAGESSGETVVVLSAMPRDGDAIDSLQLEVEVKPIGQGFDARDLATSAWVTNADRAVVRVSGLRDNEAYHWRARTRDATGRLGPWRTFGDAPETSPDFRVAVSAARLSFSTPPATTAAGGVITPAVRVTALDAEGNPVTNFSGTVRVAIETNPAGGVLSGTTSAPASGGVATFANLSIDKAGDGYRLSASADGLNGSVSAAFAITPGSAARLAFTQQPSNVAQNRPITPAIRVTAYDLHGNVATTFTSQITLAIGRDGSPLQNATLSGCLPRAAAAGVATFGDCSIDQVGSGYTLTAGAPGLPAVTSAAFNVTLALPAASSLEFGTQPSNAFVNEIIAPAVRVHALDENGDLASSYAGTITLSLVEHSSGGSLLGGGSRSAVGGFATFDNLRVDRAGRGYQLRATATGLTEAVSVPFDVGVAPPTSGDLAVTTTTTGDNRDPDGYTVTVGGSSQAIGINDSKTFPGLAAGGYAVELTGVASNCAVSGPNPRTVTVSAGATASTTFAVTCTALPPPTGSLRVTTSTTGQDLDDGYTVTVDGNSRAIGINDNGTFTGLAEGDHSVALSGIAGNCDVSGSETRTVTVTAGQTATTTFNVTCEETTPPAPVATRLTFTQNPPAVLLLNGSFSVEVTAQDDQGRQATGFTGTVTVTLEGPVVLGGLQGTTSVTAVNGVARFTNLRVTGTCALCSLRASASGLSGASSSSFSVVLSLAPPAQ